DRSGHERQPGVQCCGRGRGNRGGRRLRDGRDGRRRALGGACELGDQRGVASRRPRRAAVANRYAPRFFFTYAWTRSTTSPATSRDFSSRRSRPSVESKLTVDGGGIATLSPSFGASPVKSI